MKIELVPHLPATVKASKHRIWIADRQTNVNWQHFCNNSAFGHMCGVFSVLVWSVEDAEVDGESCPLKTTSKWTDLSGLFSRETPKSSPQKVHFILVYLITNFLGRKSLSKPTFGCRASFLLKKDTMLVWGLHPLTTRLHHIPIFVRSEWIIYSNYFISNSHYRTTLQ